MKTLVRLALLGVVIAIALSSVYVVDQTEYAIHLRMGREVGTRLEPGPYLKAPWPVDTVVRIDNRLHVKQTPEEGQEDREYVTQDKSSGIGKNVMVTTHTCWRVRRDEAAVLAFFRAMGDTESAQARIADVVVSELGAALGRHDFSTLVSAEGEQSGWGAFQANLLESCIERTEQPYGIELVDVRIQRLNFPEQNRRNVFDRMRAERSTIAAQYRSEGEESGTRIKAEAEREREVVLAEAYEEATRIRGQADAEAARLYAEAYGQDPEFYRFVRTLEAYEKTLGEGTVAILSSDSDFLRYLSAPLSKPSAKDSPDTPSTATPQDRE